MYKCLDCERVFPDTIKIVESYETWGRPSYQEYDGCPYCCGWAIEEYDPDEQTEEEYDLPD